MQEVMTDGSLGPIQEYDSERLTEMMQQAHVDHVRVFEMDQGNKVGLAAIEERDLEEKIEKVLRDKLKFEIERTKVIDEYKALTEG